MVSQKLESRIPNFYNHFYFFSLCYLFTSLFPQPPLINVPHTQPAPSALMGQTLSRRGEGEVGRRRQHGFFTQTQVSSGRFGGHSELLGVAYRVKWRGMDMPVETLWAVWNCEGTSFVWQRNVPPNSPTLREIKEV